MGLFDFLSSFSSSTQNTYGSCADEYGFKHIRDNISYKIIGRIEKVDDYEYEPGYSVKLQIKKGTEALTDINKINISPGVGQYILDDIMKSNWLRSNYKSYGMGYYEKNYDGTVALSWTVYR